MVVPIYLAEVSPSSIRGRIVTCNLIFITSGFAILKLNQKINNSNNF